MDFWNFYADFKWIFGFQKRVQMFFSRHGFLEFYADSNSKLIFMTKSCPKNSFQEKILNLKNFRIFRHNFFHNLFVTEVNLHILNQRKIASFFFK
jgi:hypothetical protein